jgi:ribonuclease HI
VTDGTRQKVKRKGALGSVVEELVVGRAFGRHDGVVGGGVLEYTSEREDNYIAELVAVVDALHALADGQRVIVEVDATSPVHSWMRFRGSSGRGKQAKLAESLLDALDAEVERHEVVVFLWTRSHTGESCNEWADILADRACKQGVAVLPARRESRHASMVFPQHRYSAMAWAMVRMTWVVRDRYRATSVRTAYHDEEVHYAVPKLEEALERVRLSILSQRCHMADAGHYWGARKRRAISELAWCPHGCSAVATWAHFQFVCPAYVQLRAGWCKRMRSFRTLAGELDGGFAHMWRRAKCGVPEEVAWIDEVTRDQVAKSAPTKDERAAVGGVVTVAKDHKGKGGRELQVAFRHMVAAGLEIQRLSLRAMEPLLLEVRRVEGNRALLDRCIGQWADRVRQAGAGMLARKGAVRHAMRSAAAQACAEYGRTVASSRTSGAVHEARRVLRAIFEEQDAWRVDRAPTCAEWRVAAAWWLWRARVAEESFRVRAEGEEVRGIWRAFGLAQRRRAVTREEAAAAAQRCMRKWYLAGGWRRAAEQHGQRQEQRKRHVLALQRVAMKRFRETGTLTGEPQREQKCWAHEIAPRKRQRFTCAGWRGRLAGRKRGREEEQGRKGFGRGEWWVVEDVVDVRRVGRKTEWLVRWAGKDEKGEKMWTDDWRNRSTVTFDAQCWRIAKQLELFVYPKQRQFIRQPLLRRRGVLADQRARRDGLKLTRRGWVEQPLDMCTDVVDSEAEGVVRDTGVGGYRRERIVGGKWSRAARRTWRAGISDSDETEEDTA